MLTLDWSIQRPQTRGVHGTRVQEWSRRPLGLAKWGGWVPKDTQPGSFQSSDNNARCAGPFPARRGCADAFPHRYSSSSLQRFPLPSASSPRSTVPLQPPYTTPQHHEFLQELAVSLTLTFSTSLTISSKYPRQWPRTSTSHQMVCWIWVSIIETLDTVIRTWHRGTLGHCRST
jgi:hypothetical protein